MAIPVATYQNFYKLTNYKVNNFVADVMDFFKTDFPPIVEFYKGNLKFIDRKRIKKLNALTEESIKLTSLFRDYKNVLNTVDYWELLVLIEELKSKLKYGQNISKYLRSSLIKDKVQSGYVFNHNLGSEQTLENVSKNILDKNDFNNQWVEIAVENDLREVDYDIDGGTPLELKDNSFQASLVTSMIDNTIGDRIYGKDIKKLLTFEDDDLVVLGYKETVYQTVDILSRLSKNDIPEFPAMGLNSNIWKGTNISRLNFPLVARELRAVFDTDDLFQNFKIRKIEYKEGDLYIEYEVNTKRDLVIINSVTV